MSGVVNVAEHTKTCEYCLATFTTCRKNTMYCSVSCGAMSRYHKKKQGKLDSLDKVCNQCATPFTAQLANTLYCSKKCGSLALYYENRESYQARSREWKENNPERVKEKEREWWQKNREHGLALNRRWVAENPERRARSNRDWWQANREHVAERRRKWLRDNPSYYSNRYIENRDAMLEQNRAWRRDNPDKSRLKNMLRYARKRNAETSSFSDDDLLAAWAAAGIDARLCTYCTGAADQWDHVTPLSKGGAHAVENYLPSCKVCNQRKSAKALREWAPALVTHVTRLQKRLAGDSAEVSNA